MGGKRRGWLLFRYVVRGAMAAAVLERGGGGILSRALFFFSGRRGESKSSMDDPER